jgi:hypothetical protein
VKIVSGEQTTTNSQLLLATTSQIVKDDGQALKDEKKSVKLVGTTTSEFADDVEPVVFYKLLIYVIKSHAKSSTMMSSFIDPKFNQLSKNTYTSFLSGSRYMLYIEA